MIEKISNYAEAIVILIIIITIVELMLPEGKNKKYVMFVSGIIIMLSVIKPFINFLNLDLNLELEVAEIQETFNNFEKNSFAKYDLNYNIQDSYIKNLEVDMKARLEEMGYNVLETKINVDEDTYEPINIEMRVKYDDEYIQPVIIDVFGDNTTDMIYEVDINKIKEIISSNYGVVKNNIRINNY